MPNDVEEKVEITVTETEEVEDEKEFTFLLNTMQSGEVIFVTPQIKGELQALLLISEKPINVRIWIENWPDMELLNVRNIQGDNYLPLRISPVASDGEQFNFAPQEWVLNDRLVIHVDGNLNTETKFILRLD